MSIDTLANSSGYYAANQSNGHGYECSVPAQATDFMESLSQAGEAFRFSETTSILAGAVVYNSVLVEGEPGAGKSHLVHDIIDHCRVRGVPFLQLSVHINAGTLGHIDSAIGLMEDFLQRTASSGVQAACVLDNIDFVGFRNTNRKTGKALGYANLVAPVLRQLITAPHIATIGMAHSEGWRAQRWQWPAGGQYEQITVAAHGLLDAFASRHTFLGSMHPDEIATALRQRDIDPHKSARISGVLGTMGLSQFVYAQHIDPEQFMVDPLAACATVDDGRLKRTVGKAKS